MNDFKEDPSLTERYTALRRRLHEKAECGFALDRTREIITDELCDIGIEYKILGKGSIAARIGRGKEGVLLRADMDALYMRESSGVSYAATGECAHACGHDMHTAMLLYAARLLKNEESSLPFEIRLLFQAAEETLTGAADAIESGILLPWDRLCEKMQENGEKCKELYAEKDEKPFIKRAYSLHTMVGVALEVGTILVPSSGVGAPASDFFKLRIKGKESHGAVPHLGVDAIMAMCCALISLGTLGTRTASPEDAPMITIGRISGGENANVICSLAEAQGTVRSLDDTTQERLREQMCLCAQSIARAWGAEAELSFFGSAPTLINDADTVRAALDALRERFGGRVLGASELSGCDAKKRSGGSEDFASFSHAVPSLLVGICAGDLREGYRFPLHHPAVQFDERALVIGAETYRTLALLDPDAARKGEMRRGC